MSVKELLSKLLFVIGAAGVLLIMSVLALPALIEVVAERLKR